MTDKQYNDCYIDQYLWHVFSYEVVFKENVLTGDMARKAYNSIDKETGIGYLLGFTRRVSGMRKGEIDYGFVSQLVNDEMINLCI